MWIGLVSVSRCSDTAGHGPPILLARTARKSCGSARLPAVLLGLALAGGWGAPGTVARGASPAETIPAQSVPPPRFASLSRADSLTIESSWMGLSPVAPLEARYTLRRDGENFTGQAHFLAGKRRRRETIVIPLPAVRNFLNQLLSTPMKPGKYTPRIDHTDDYPTLRIVVKNG